MSNGKILIDELYQAETDNVDETKYMKLSVRIRFEDVGFYTALAERFGTSRVKILRDMFDDMSHDMFSNLSKEDRAVISERADQETTALLKKAGFEVSSSGVAGNILEDQTWRSFDGALNQLGSKK